MKIKEIPPAQNFMSDHICFHSVGRSLSPRKVLNQVLTSPSPPPVDWKVWGEWWCLTQQVSESAASAALPQMVAGYRGLQNRSSIMANMQGCIRSQILMSLLNGDLSVRNQNVGSWIFSSIKRPNTFDLKVSIKLFSHPYTLASIFVIPFCLKLYISSPF